MSLSRYHLCVILCLILYLLVQVQKVHFGPPKYWAEGPQESASFASGIQTSSVVNISYLSSRSIEGTASTATWKKKTFCHDFLVNTFHDEVPMCGGKEVSQTDQVKCSGTVYTNNMAMCSYEYLALRPSKLRV